MLIAVPLFVPLFTVVLVHGWYIFRAPGLEGRGALAGGAQVRRRVTSSNPGPSPRLVDGSGEHSLFEVGQRGGACVEMCVSNDAQRIVENIPRSERTTIYQG